MEITGNVVEFTDQSGVTKAGKEFKKVPTGYQKQRGL